jgi:hypothetical protein
MDSAAETSDFLIMNCNYLLQSFDYQANPLRRNAKPMLIVSYNYHIECLVAYIDSFFEWIPQ